MAFVLDMESNRKLSVALGRVERFRAEWAAEACGSPELRRRMEVAARAASIGALCRLSGIHVDDASVQAMIDGHDHGLPGAIAGDVEGCRAALAGPLPPIDRLLSAEDLARLNAVIGNRGDDPSTFRSVDLLREAFDADGQSTGRVYPGLAPSLLPATVDELLTWLECELRDRRRNEVLAVAGFTLGLLAACPFPRRNGRTALATLDILLRRAGHGWLSAGSLLAELETRRTEYHDAFDAARSRIWAGESNPQPWIELIVDAVDRVRERVAARVELEEGASAFPPLQRAILDEVNRHGTVDAGMLLEATGANRNTLKDNLKRMVECGVLERSGRRRGTRYRLRPLN